MTFEQFLVTYYTQTALSAVVSIVALIHFRSRSTEVKLIGFSFLLSFICNGLAFVFLKLGHTSYINVPQNIYHLLNLCIVIALYHSALAPKYRIWLFTTLAICFPFSFYDTFIDYKSFVESYFPFVQSMFIITFTILYFHRLLIDMPAVHLQRLPMFWFNSAFLFFHAGTLFLWAFSAYLMHVLNDNLLEYWSFHNIVSILQHIIIIIGLRADFKSRGKVGEIQSV
jgi:hypothetical protein